MSSRTVFCRVSPICTSCIMGTTLAGIEERGYPSQVARRYNFGERSCQFLVVSCQEEVGSCQWVSGVRYQVSEKNAISSQLNGSARLKPCPGTRRQSGCQW